MMALGIDKKGQTSQTRIVTLSGRDVLTQLEGPQQKPAQWPWILQSLEV